MKFWSQRLTLIYSVDIKFSCFTTPPIRHHSSVTKSFKRRGSQCIRVARVIRESREKMPRSLRSRTVLIFFSCILYNVQLKSLIRSFLANCTILNCESYHSVPHLPRQFSWHCSWAHTILSTSIFSLYDPRSFERYLSVRQKGLNGTRTLTSAMPVQCFTSWAISQTGGWFYVSPR